MPYYNKTKDTETNKKRKENAVDQQDKRHTSTKKERKMQQFNKTEDT